jgi:hypothetical protein
LDELLPACGASAMPRLALPDPREARSLFAGVDDAAERLRRLVDEVFGIYERAAVIVERIRLERDLHPVLEGTHELVTWARGGPT